MKKAIQMYSFAQKKSHFLRRPPYKKNRKYSQCFVYLGKFVFRRGREK